MGMSRRTRSTSQSSLSPSDFVVEAIEAYTEGRIYEHDDDWFDDLCQLDEDFWYDEEERHELF